MGLTALAACATPTLEAAVPSAPPSGVEGRVDATVVTLDLPEAVLSVEVQEAEPMYLWMTLEPKRGGLELDPMAVGLTTHDGRLPLMSYLGTAEPWISPRAIYRGCGPRVYEFGWSYPKVDVFVHEMQQGNPEKGISTVPAPPVAIETTSCFIFFFDAKPVSDHRYTFELDGLRSGNQAVRVPTLTFEKGTVRKTVPVP